MPVLSASSLSLTSSQPMMVAGLMAINARPFWYVSLLYEVTVWANPSGGISLASHICLMISSPVLFAGFLISGTPFSSLIRPPYAQRIVTRLFMWSPSWPIAMANVNVWGGFWTFG